MKTRQIDNAGMERRELDLKFRLDDLSGESARRLIARHLAAMRSNSPPESVHALDVEGLRFA